MSKMKKYANIGLGLLTVSAASFSTTATEENNKDTVDSLFQKECQITTPPKSPLVEDSLQKRTPQKIYHRFEEIPEISDEEAALYNKDEYTYIINADVYQKNNKIELKRVLSKEVSQVNALSLIYRSENATYIPQPDEDQIACYDIDFTVINPSGTFKGPSQMDDVAATSFIKYLAINPKTRANVLPLLKYSTSSKKDVAPTLDSALVILEKKFYDEEQHIRPFDERQDIITDKNFLAMRINTTAWQELASDNLKRYISKEEKKRHKKLSATTKCFLCLSELIPNQDTLKHELETYNLTTYPLGRKGYPKQIMMALALSLNLKTEEDNLDATRIPLFVIAASVSTLNWHGNGLEALSEARAFKKTYTQHPDDYDKYLKLLAKKWTAGKGRRYGIDELAKLNIISPEIIQQFQIMELPGAENLMQRYMHAVEIEENKIKEQQKEIPPLALNILSNQKRHTK